MTNEAKELLKSKPELCLEIATNYCEKWWDSNDSNLVIWKSFLKEHTKKDWEILSFKHTRNNELILLKEDGSYGYEPMDYKGLSLECMLHKGDCVDNGLISIHSVRRLSDNEVFTEGMDTDIGKIKRFAIVKDTMRVECESHDTCCDVDISRITKRTPLFITEDGVNIFEGDEITPVAIRNFKIYPSDRSWKGNSPEKFKYFSTREAAEQWVEDHKPRYSIAYLKARGLHI